MCYSHIGLCMSVCLAALGAVHVNAVRVPFLRSHHVRYQVSVLLSTTVT